jgi:hypothetical protein
VVVYVLAKSRGLVCRIIVSVVASKVGVEKREEVWRGIYAKLYTLVNGFLVLSLLDVKCGQAAVLLTRSEGRRLEHPFHSYEKVEIRYNKLLGKKV